MRFEEAKPTAYREREGWRRRKDRCEVGYEGSTEGETAAGVGGWRGGEFREGRRRRVRVGHGGGHDALKHLINTQAKGVALRIIVMSCRGLVDARVGCMGRAFLGWLLQEL